MSKKEIKIKTRGDVQSIISYLESIISSLKEGQIVIQNNNSFVSLKPVDDISMELEAEQKKGKEELTIELSWKSEQVITEESESRLIISSKEPEPVQEEAVSAEPEIS